jgi:hypothetical protein
VKGWDRLLVASILDGSTSLLVLAVADNAILPGTAGGSGVTLRDAFLTVPSYVVVAFSTLVQGLSIGRLTRRWLGRAA